MFAQKGTKTVGRTTIHEEDSMLVIDELIFANILICIFPMLIYEILRYAVFSLTVYYSAFQPLY